MNELCGKFVIDLYLHLGNVYLFRFSSIRSSLRNVFVSHFMKGKLMDSIVMTIMYLPQLCSVAFDRKPDGDT